MIVICDMDEVICDFTNTLLKAYNCKYKSGIKKEDLTKWALPQEMKDIFLETESFFIEMPPFDGAIEFVKELKSISADLLIATCASGVSRIAKEKMLWMEIWLPELVNNMCITSRKDMLRGDYIIDDCPDHLKSFCGTPIVWDRPWNKNKIDREVRIHNNDYCKAIKYLESRC